MKTFLRDVSVRIAYEIEGTQHKHSFVEGYQAEHIDVTLRLNENHDISALMLSVHPHQYLCQRGIDLD